MSLGGTLVTDLAGNSVPVGSVGSFSVQIVSGTAIQPSSQVSAGAIEASRLVRDTTLAVDRYLAKLESEIGALALGVVRRVLGELDIADVVARAAAQALSEFRQEKFVKVTVHPAAVDRVSTALAALSQEGGPAVTVEPDPAVDQGACIVTSDFAVVEASIEAQLRAFAADLRSRERDAKS